MKSLTAILSAGSLAACGLVPAPASTPPAPQGAAVGFGQSVQIGDLTATPIAVVEDSRCPVNARCVWAGRLIVRTRIDGLAASGRWRDIAELHLGESYGTHGRIIALVSGEPGRTTDRPTRREDYRFTYEAR